MNKRRSPRAGVIAHDAALNFDDVGPEVAQQHGAIGPGKRFREFNNANRIEHGLHSGILSRQPGNRIQTALEIDATVGSLRKTRYLAMAKSWSASFSVAGT